MLYYCLLSLLFFPHCGRGPWCGRPRPFLPSHLILVPKVCAYVLFQENMKQAGAVYELPTPGIPLPSLSLSFPFRIFFFLFFFSLPCARKIDFIDFTSPYCVGQIFSTDPPPLLLVPLCVCVDACDGILV